MPDRRPWIAKRHISRLRRAAIQYVAHGWPIARLAVPRGGRCPCGLLGCVEPHLLLGSCPLITDPAAAERAFADGRWAIALPTWRFDVIEVHARFGAPLHYQLKTSCPTALAPTGRWWQFFVTPDSVPVSLVEAAGGKIISGAERWVAAPGSTTESSGRIRWLVPPKMTNWRPYQRRDAIDMVLGPIDGCTSWVPGTDLPPIISNALV